MFSEPEPRMGPAPPVRLFPPPQPRRVEVDPTRNAVALKRDGRRARMLDRLRCGPATTLEMMMLGGAGFSSRLHELREAGHRITCVEQDDGAIYTLVVP